jgi:DNA-binding MarR family transcriptional regulator
MRLTAKGGALIARIVPIANAYQAELMALLGPDAEGFQTGLHRLYEDR